MSQGYAVGRGGDKKLHRRAGLWLLLLPMFMMSVSFIPMAVENDLGGAAREIGSAIGGMVGLTLMSLFLAMYVAIVYKTTRNYLRWKNEQKATTPTSALSAEPMAARAAERSTCLACGQTIPDKEKQCPNCGWSGRHIIMERVTKFVAELSFLTGTHIIFGRG